MKKITLLFFIAFIALSCSVTKYDNSYRPFTNGVEFKVVNINLAKFSDLGENPHYSYMAGKGGRILQVFFKLKNNTQEKKELDLGGFYVLDSNNRKYEPTGVVQAGKLNGVYFGEFDIKLKANKERTFIMTFKPAFPKDEKVTRVLVNGEVYDLNISS